MGNNKTYIDLMIDSLNKKVNVLEKIMEVNKNQAQIVADDKFDIEEFDAMVTCKGGLIDEVNKLDEGFETLYARVREELQDNKALYSDEILQMKSLIKRITEMSASIETDEKRTKASMETRFSKIKETAKSTRKNSKAVSNYYKNMSKIDSEPQFMDKKK